MVEAEWGVSGRIKWFSYLVFIRPEVFGFRNDIEVEVGGFAGAEVFGFELFGGDFVSADDDAVFGDFAGVSEFVAEFLAGEDNGGAVAVVAEFGGDVHGFVVFVFGHGDDTIVDEVISDGVEEIGFV